MIKDLYRIKETLDIDNPLFEKNLRFNSYKELFSRQLGSYLDNVTAKQRHTTFAIKIIKTFWNCVMNDLLDNDVEVVLNKQSGIMVKISYRLDFKLSFYKYNTRTGGKNYCVRFRMNKGFINLLGSYYFPYNQQRVKREIEKRIDQGYAWS